jgi:hypothetical protein
LEFAFLDVKKSPKKAVRVGKYVYRLRRNYIGFELNPEYIKIAEKRLYGITQQLFV